MLLITHNTIKTKCLSQVKQRITTGPHQFYESLHLQTTNTRSPFHKIPAPTYRPVQYQYHNILSLRAAVRINGSKIKKKNKKIMQLIRSK